MKDYGHSSLAALCTTTVQDNYRKSSQLVLLVLEKKKTSQYIVAQVRQEHSYTPFYNVKATIKILKEAKMRWQ